jgi:hypothetical protein
MDLEAVSGEAVWECHDAGIVYEQVESLVAVGEASRKGSHRPEVSEVESLHLDPGFWRRLTDARSGLVTAGDIPSGRNYVSAGPCEPSGGEEAEPAVSSGDDGEAPTLIRDV